MKRFNFCAFTLSMSSWSSSCHMGTSRNSTSNWLVLSMDSAHFFWTSAKLILVNCAQMAVLPPRVLVFDWNVRLEDACEELPPAEMLAVADAKIAL
jgi:hypothetical protein